MSKESYPVIRCQVSNSKNLESILNDFPSALISKTDQPIVRGITITESIKSEKRKRYYGR